MSTWWDPAANRYRSTLPHKVLYVWGWPVIRAVMSALPPETAQHLAIRGIQATWWVDRIWRVAASRRKREPDILGRHEMTDTDAIRTLVEAIRPILAGHPAPVQSAALADCLAMWLAGHEVPGKMHLTRQMRAALLAEHCALVQQLVPINAKAMGTMS